MTLTLLKGRRMRAAAKYGLGMVLIGGQLLLLSGCYGSACGSLANE